ncbi:hemerythrin domain-containing protein [Nocardioides sp. DS6]|uniref:Hemerythrin domain-containing protein n=1 Tax=Nocardioides eburneus TaxID=3231482 RepID=A0ABV3T3T2_9ACTN
MGDAAEDRAKAAELPEGDVIRILLEQHARIRDLFTEVKTASGEARQTAFDNLRSLLAVHETAEEMILRPVTGEAGGKEIADARNQEEAEANEVLAELEKLDVTTVDFDTRLVAFEKSVDDHAEAEEHEEFPLVLETCSPDMRRQLGSRLQAAEAAAPTHPHPSAAGSTAKQMVMGPFASLVDRVKDAITKSGS